jgi:hypothetical protein
VPTEVLSTPRAQQQIAMLDRVHARVLDEFLDDLAAGCCRALACRLSGPTTIDRMCFKHLRGTLPFVVALTL